MGLAVVVAAAEHGDLAAGVDPHGGDVPEPHAAAEGGGKPARPGAARADEGGHADPHQHAVLPEPRLLGLERVEIGERAGLVEYRREVAHVVGDAGRARIGHGGGRHEVAGAGLDRIAGHFPRAVLDQALDDVGDLRIAGAAIGVDRRGVGVDAEHPAMQRGDRVLAGEHGDAEERRDAGGELALVGAEIGDDVGLDGGDAPVGVEGHARLGHVVAGVDVHRERLGAGRGPAHRPAHQTRGPGQARLLGVVIGLLAEAAADIGGHHPDRVLGRAQRVAREPLADQMRVLRGGPEGVALAAAIVLADGRARLHGAGRKPVVDELERGDVGGGGEGGFRRLGIAEPPVVGDVALELFVDQRHIRLDRGGKISDRGERLPRNLDGGRSVGGGVRVLGDDEGHRVPHVAGLAGREDRPAGERHRGAVVGVDVPQDVGVAAAVAPPVLAGEHRQHPRHGARTLRGDRPDAGTGVGAADEGGVGLPRQADVVHEPAPAGQKAVVLQACVRRADVRHPCSPFAMATAVRGRSPQGRLVSGRLGVHPQRWARAKVR